MGVKNFEIILRSRHAVFQASECIEGTVQLELNESTKAEGQNLGR